MPRRKPSELRRPARRDNITPDELACIQGLSRRVHQCLANAGEEALRPKAVAFSLRRWADAVSGPAPLEPEVNGGSLPARAADARQTLAHAVQALPLELRPELLALMEPLDRRLLDRLIFEPVEAGWWYSSDLE